MEGSWDLAQYVIRRALLVIPTVLLSSLLIFMLMRALPGDPATLQLGDQGGRAEAAKLREQLGLDKPLYLQYFIWLSHVARGDLGNSLRSRQPVVDDLKRAIPVSAELAIGGLAVAWLTALPLGIAAATHRAGWIDYLSRIIAVAGLSIPGFVVGTLVVLFLALWFHWLPPTGYVPFYKDPWTNVQQFIFPAIVVGYRSAALLSRMVRSSLLDVLGQDYMRTAKAKGLGGWIVIRRHAMKNSLIPAVTLMGAQVGALLAGAVITESIFSLPGVGRLFINAVNGRDYTLIQAVMLFIAVVVTVCNLLVDLSYGLLDPRIRYS